MFFESIKVFEKITLIRKKSCFEKFMSFRKNHVFSKESIVLEKRHEFRTNESFS